MVAEAEVHRPELRVELQLALKQEVYDMRTVLGNEITKLDQKFTGEITKLDQKLTGEIGRLREDVAGIKAQIHTMMIPVWLGVMAHIVQQLVPLIMGLLKLNS